MTVKPSASKKATTNKLVKTASVYLAHPIASANLYSAQWKSEFLEAYESAKLPFTLIDPSRNGFVEGKHDDMIVKANKTQIAQSLAVVAYATTPSAGTSMEILYAYMLHVPVYTFCNVRIPAWVMMHSTQVCYSIEGLINQLRRIAV